MRIIVEQYNPYTKAYTTLFLVTISEIKKQKLPMRFTNTEQTSMFRIAIVK